MVDFVHNKREEFKEDHKNSEKASSALQFLVNNDLFFSLSFSL